MVALLRSCSRPEGARATLTEQKWGLILLGVALWTTGCLVFNPVLRSIGILGIVTAYAIGLWMAITLPWVVALTTRCVFAATGGAISLAYERWARLRARLRALADDDPAGAGGDARGRRLAGARAPGSVTRSHRAIRSSTSERESDPE